MHLTNGQRRTLGERQLLEAAALSDNVEAHVDELIEAGQLDEALLEEEFMELGPRGGASEAEMRAKALRYPPHAGGIGSKVPEPIGKGVGRKYPAGFQHIRNALIRSGHSVAQASMIAYGALRRWRSGGGKVKPETRAKAGKVLGELEVGGKASRVKTAAKVAAREATTTSLRHAIRLRTGLEPALSAYLSERGDDRPVNEDPESLREAAQRAISGHGPLRPRSRIDQRVLDAQARSVAARSRDTPMQEATRMTTHITQLEHGLREDEPPPDEPSGGVFVNLPPEKGTLPTVVVDEDTKRIGEAVPPRELDHTDLGELQEQAIALYNRTAAPTYQGRSYLSSAGRVELTQLVASLREALDSPVAPLADEVTPTPADPLGGPTLIVPGRLPNGEAPPADTPHSPEELAYADAALKRSGYSRDGRSAQGDYVLTADLYPAGTEVQKPLMEGEELRESGVAEEAGRAAAAAVLEARRVEPGFERPADLMARPHAPATHNPGWGPKAGRRQRIKGPDGRVLGHVYNAGGRFHVGSFHAFANDRQKTHLAERETFDGAVKAIYAHHGIDAPRNWRSHLTEGRYSAIPGQPFSRSGFHNLGTQGTPRSVTKMSDEKLQYLHGHKRTHPALRQRVHAELLDRGYRTRMPRTFKEGGYRGSKHAVGRYAPIPGERHSTSGFHNLSELDKPRSVTQMSTEKLKYLHGHKRTHPTLRKRVHAELVARGFRPRTKVKVKEANWMSGAVKHPGQLHRDLGVPQGKKIPMSKIRAAATSHKDPKVRARARLALRFAAARHVQEAGRLASPRLQRAPGAAKWDLSDLIVHHSTAMKAAHVELRSAIKRGDKRAASERLGAADRFKHHRGRSRSRHSALSTRER